MSLSEEQKRKIDAEKFLGTPEELEFIGDEEDVEIVCSEKVKEVED